MKFTQGMHSLLAGICALTLFGGASFADSITLRNAVRLPAGASSVKLADIADLAGPDAQRFADLKIVEASSVTEGTEITVQQIRRALDQAGVHWGRVNLSGRRVTVRPSRSGSVAEAPLAMTGMSLETPERPSLEPADPLATAQGCEELIELPTLRGSIATLLVSTHNVPAADLKLAFDPKDNALLDSTDQTTRHEIQPLGDVRLSDRIDIQIRTWRDGRVQERHFVRVLSFRRVMVAALKQDVVKDQPIAEGDVELREQWLPVGQAATTCDVIRAVGRVASTNLRTGQLVHEAHVRREALVKRGDKVVVRCLVGGVAISLQAEAREDGLEGDLIEFRKVGERATFLAAVTGRGEAVVDLAHR